MYLRNVIQVIICESDYIRRCIKWGIKKRRTIEKNKVVFVENIILHQQSKYLFILFLKFYF